MDEDCAWNNQIYGDGTLEVGLLFGFESQLFGVGDNVKDMLNTLDIYEGPCYKITPHECIRVHEYYQKDHSIWSKHFLIVYVHVLNKWWNLYDGSQVCLCPNIWRASLSSGANLHKKWRILFASFRYVKTKIAPFA